MPTAVRLLALYIYGVMHRFQNTFREILLILTYPWLVRHARMCYSHFTVKTKQNTWSPERLSDLCTNYIDRKVFWLEVRNFKPVALMNQKKQDYVEVKSCTATPTPWSHWLDTTQQMLLLLHFQLEVHGRRVGRLYSTWLLGDSGCQRHHCLMTMPSHYMTWGFAAAREEKVENSQPFFLC